MLDYEYKHKVLGYKEVGKPIELDDKLLRVGEYLDDIFDKEFFIKYDLDLKKDLKSEAKKFFKNNQITFHKVLLEKESEVKNYKYIQAKKLRWKFILKEENDW